MDKSEVIKRIEEYYELKIEEIDDEYIALQIPEDLANKVHRRSLAGRVVFHKKGNEALPEALYQIYSVEDCKRLAQLLNLL